MTSTRTPLVITLAAGLVLGSAATWLITRAPKPAPSEAPVLKYHCPMHPEVVRDAPGQCPICGMELVAFNPSALAPKTGERKIAFYRNPMDASVHSPVPMDDPMGMAYVPVYEDELGGAAPVPGLADITIDPAYQRLIGVRTVEVTKGPVGGSWSTPATVAVDEARVFKIATKTGGFVDKLFVDFVGKPVRKGQPLFALYSPELYSAQQDLALAVRSKAALGADGAALVEASAKRLRLWDVPESEIQRLEQGGEPKRDLLFTSPVSGAVTAKTIVQGARLQAGDTPFEVTDLSEVWVLAEGYAGDLPKLKVGAKASFTAPSLPGRTFRGRVAFVDPVVDPQTRTAKVRLAFANPGGELRPGTYGTAVFPGGATGLRVPFAAVMDDGGSKVVFVDEGEGHFAPRVIQIGGQDADWVEVRSGLEAGEQVADKATFLLDSESRRRAALTATKPGDAK